MRDCIQLSSWLTDTIDSRIRPPPPPKTKKMYLSENWLYLSGIKFVYDEEYLPLSKTLVVTRDHRRLKYIVVCWKPPTQTRNTQKQAGEANHLRAQLAEKNFELEESAAALEAVQEELTHAAHALRMCLQLLIQHVCGPPLAVSLPPYLIS